MNALSDREMAYQQSLAAANGFTPEDVATNRTGKITERQRSKLKFSPMIGCFGILFLIGAGMLIGPLINGQVLPIAIVIGLLVIGLALFLASRWYKEWSEGQVESCEGVVIKEEVKRQAHGGGLLGALIGELLGAAFGIGRDYFYKLDNNVKVKVPRAGFSALEENRLYRVYYTRTRKLLSIEVLADMNPNRSVPQFKQFQ